MAEQPNTDEQNFAFGTALFYLKKGRCVRRTGWNGKGMFLFMRPADSLPIGIIPNIKSLPKSAKNFIMAKAGGEEIKQDFGAYICMYAADGSIVNGWLASQTDMLAMDWQVLEEA